MGARPWLPGDDRSQGVRFAGHSGRSRSRGQRVKDALHQSLDNDILERLDAGLELAVCVTAALNLAMVNVEILEPPCAANTGSPIRSSRRAQVEHAMGRVCGVRVRSERTHAPVA